MTENRNINQLHSKTSGSAFIIEILVLLLFVVASMAIFMQMLSNSKQISESSKNLTTAIQLATNASERFSADPTSATNSLDVDSLTVSTIVKSDKWESGIMYHATIVVKDNANTEIYKLNNDKYIPDIKDSPSESAQSSDTAQEPTADNNESTVTAPESISLENELTPTHNASGDAYAL